MFGLSWGQIAIIVLVGVFVLGPERIPTAVSWVMSTLRKARTMAAGAQEELRREIGPEIEELRRQVADLQSLKELQELRELRDLHPKRLIGKNILGDEFSGGMTGFLGMNSPKESAPGPGAVSPPATASQQQVGAAAAPAAKAVRPSGTPGDAAANFLASSSPSPSTPPSMTKLAAPKVVGRPPIRPPDRPSGAADATPFDPDGT